MRSPALLAAIALGALAEAIVRVPGRPGLNVALWALAGVAVLVMMFRRRPDPAARESWLLVCAALGFAVVLPLRDAESLAIFALLAAVSLLLLAAGRGGAAWASQAHPGEIAIGVARVAMLCAFGPFGWGRGERGSASAGWQRSTLALARGTMLALPPMFVLGALLMSADPVFARVVHGFVRIDLAPLLEHLAFAAFIAWLTAGFLGAIVVPDAGALSGSRLPQPGWPAAEVAVALWALNLMFIVFIAVQLRYLFGGVDLVEVTPGLTYAEYARRGFFELVAAAALVVPLLLLADWAATPATARARTAMRGTMLLLVLLLMGVLASAAWRMGLYQDAYGLTEQRLYVSVAIAWLAAVLAWLALTVLRGRRERFTFGAFVAGLACIAIMHVMNPHALIARVNLDRATAGLPYDGEYLVRLSADAVPTLIAGVDRVGRLPELERCRIAGMLVKRWGGERPGDWRTWNLGEWRARRLVEAGFRIPAGCSA